ncbi:MAG: DUF1289 domain-containing protein [Woeseia sp.]
MDEFARKALLQGRPASPCTRVCTLDDQDVCLGCLRTLAEIVGWARMTAEEQRVLIDELPARRR